MIAKPARSFADHALRDKLKACRPGVSAMSSPYKVHIALSMSEIDAAQWDACANPGTDNCDDPYAAERFNPFITHAFLNALETSKSVGSPDRLDQHPCSRQGRGGPFAAAAPAYLKTHSMGEYVFDHGWADAYHRAGLHYYPKLQAAVPSRRSRAAGLAAPGHGEAARKTLIAGLRLAKAEASSLHITFPAKAEWDMLGASGFPQRTGQQFHFINPGYADFDAFLADLARASAR